MLFLVLSMFSRMSLADPTTLNIATEGAFPPFNFVKDSVVSGFEIDLVNDLAQKIGMKTSWRTLGFDGLLIGLKQGKYDLVAASHAITEERSKAVDFLPPHYCSGAMIVSLKSGLRRKNDLKGKTVATQVSSIYPKWIEKNLPESKPKLFPTETDALQALIQKKVDAAITDRFLAQEFAKRNPEVHLGDFLNPERNAMAVKKGNAALRKKLTDALNRSFQDGTYKKLSLKYFGEDIRCPDSMSVKK